MRYVSLPDPATLAEIDAALASLLARRRATGFALVRAWVDAEIDECLELRFQAELEAMV
jgi:hypothetical protein